MMATQQRPHPPHQSSIGATLHGLNSLVEQKTVPIPKEARHYHGTTPSPTRAPTSKTKKSSPTPKVHLQHSHSQPQLLGAKQKPRVAKRQESPRKSKPRKKDKLDLFLEQQNDAQAEQEQQRPTADERSRGAYTTVSKMIKSNAPKQKEDGAALGSFLDARQQELSPGQKRSSARSTFTSMTEARKQAFAGDNPPLPQSREELIHLLRQAAANDKNKKDPQCAHDKNNHTTTTRPSSPRKNPTSPRRAARNAAAAAAANSMIHSTITEVDQEVDFSNHPQRTETEESKQEDKESEPRRTKQPSPRRGRRVQTNTTLRASSSSSSLLPSTTNPPPLPKNDPLQHESAPTSPPPPRHSELRRPSGALVVDPSSSPAKSRAVYQRRMSNPTREEFSARTLHYGGAPVRGEPTAPPVPSSHSSHHRRALLLPTTNKDAARGASLISNISSPHHHPGDNQETSDIFTFFSWNKGGTPPLDPAAIRSNRDILCGSIQDNPLHKALLWE